MPERSARTRGDLAFWAVTLAGLAAVRIPYLTSPLYILDNDEAVLGIMARRMAAGVEWPLYFAGQSYGLAVVETVPAALAFRLIGDSGAVLTGTIVALFLVGLVSYARALERISGSRAWGRALTVGLALLPGWVVWSTKARGLYVAGFVLSGFLLALLTREARGRGHVAMAAALLGVVALVQPIWLVVSLPFLVAGRLSLRELGGVGAVAFALWCAPTVALTGREAYWQPDFLGPGLNRFAVLLPPLTAAFAGRVVPNEPTMLATGIGWVGALAFFAVMIALGVDALRARSRVALVLATAMAASVLHVFVLNLWVPRYFLPSTVLTFVGSATWIGARGVRFGRRAAIVSGAVVAVLSLAALELGQPPDGSVLADVPAREDLRGLLDGLVEDDIRGVYAASSDIQWQILFYGDQAIPTRGTSATDRYPEFPRAVAEARRQGLPTALVADVRRLRGELPGVGGFPGYRVGERYLRLDDPSILELGLLGFELEASETPR